MFQKTLALSTNPFDPDNHPKWHNLGGDPLRVDQDAALMSLFCWELGGLQQSKATIDGFLFNPHKPGDKPAPKPGIIVIAGGKGTGKTTLASYIKLRVLQESTIPATSWQHRDVPFPGADDLTRPTVFADRVNELRAELEGLVGKPRENIFMFLDNVPIGSFGAISNFYQDFNMHMQVYVVTTTDLTLKQKELNWSMAARVKVIQTRNVNAAELQAFIAERVKLYRDPKRAEFDKLSAMFPWAATAVQRLVGANPDSDQPLRLLNRWLSDDVGEYHAKYSADPRVDMATLPPPDLIKFMIA